MNLLPQLLAVSLLGLSTSAQVVINEVFYNAPEDIDDLEYIELHNASDTPADLSGWEFTKGIKFVFPSGATIPPQGFIVLCRDAARFAQYYRTPAAGTFKQTLSNDGETLELSDASGRVVDQLSYTDRAPWPLGADGESGSLERICPAASGAEPFNWASSPLSPDRIAPVGTPGQPNANYAPELPPVISDLKFSPENPAPGQPINVTASLRGATTNHSTRLTLLFRGGNNGIPETAVPMLQTSPGLFAGTIPGQLAGSLLRFRIGARSLSGVTRFFPAPHEPRPALSLYIGGAPNAGKIPLAYILAPESVQFTPRPRRWRGERNEMPQAAAPHTSTFVYYDPAVRRFECFDFVQVAPRPGGWKVRLHKDQLLREMSTLNITFENDRGVLAEPLAYEIYRRAGIAAPQSWHVRLTMNNQPLGYHLLFEQPNRSFLRRNKIDDDGNMYKILWYEQGVVAQHEKKTNTQQGHEDIIALVQALEQSEGRAQWEVIKKNFDIRQVATYFAVNMVLSHWDGYFNNYFTYHDVNGKGKWTMYPWDQDQTWGILNHDPDFVLTTMPVTFGMNGDVPPGQRSRGDSRQFRFGEGPSWWRPPGYFSGPLLANEQFRPFFLARTREILESVYTPEKIGPVIDSLSKNLRDEVKFRAEITGSDARWDLEQFDRRIRAFHTHLIKRREFLFKQPEIKNALRMR